MPPVPVSPRRIIHPDCLLIVYRCTCVPVYTRRTILPDCLLIVYQCTVCTGCAPALGSTRQFAHIVPVHRMHRPCGEGAPTRDVELPGHGDPRSVADVMVSADEVVQRLGAFVE